MNFFGSKFRFTSFGESHGVAIGGVLDGLPAGLKIDENFIANQMARRKGGGKYATPRKEADLVEILSGVFENKSTGAPIGFIIKNENTKSKDYADVAELFRPAHADFGYFSKYGFRDYRGGGRSSARESAVRVAVGAFAQLFLAEFGIKVRSGILDIGKVCAIKKVFTSQDYENAANSEIFALDKNTEEAQKMAISSARANGDSIGGVALLSAIGVPAGLGEPLYGKLDSKIGEAFLGLNAVKCVEIGDGAASAKLLGSQNNDEMFAQELFEGGRNAGFFSNHCGGILGGISTGAEILIKVHFKPTPSISKMQRTINTSFENVECSIKGRHDPCVAVRGAVVCESMLACILADLLLCGACARLEMVKKAWGF